MERNTSLRAGDKLVLNCKATGLPPPQVTWARSGRVLRNHTLVVNRVNKRDGGLYLCKAHSTAGEDSMKIFVRVEINQYKQQVGRSSHLVTRVAVADPWERPALHSPPLPLCLSVGLDPPMNCIQLVILEHPTLWCFPFQFIFVYSTFSSCMFQTQARNCLNYS